jgi:hypothetical protein
VPRSVCVEAFDDPLTAVRGILDGADEALLGVAFVQQRGVNLLEPQLKTVARGRLVATTVFGSTTMQGLTAAQRGGLDVRVLNPSRGTFHPKLYIARHGDEIAAVIGSANLTSGLIANVEAGAVLRGDRTAPPLRRLWELAESWWDHVDAVTWSPERTVAAREVLAPDLLTAVTAVLAANPLVRTISDAKENRVHEVTPDGVWVETAKSRVLGRPAQLVEAWMIQIAWDWLQAHGSITARFLVATDGLNVKRSSFVCALLARLPDVHIASRRPIELRLRRTTSP